MKSIIISIRPEFVAKILNGEKTWEVRKTAPVEWMKILSYKLARWPEPFRVYIYCTKEGPGLWYVKNKTYEGGHAYVGEHVERVHNGKVVAKFTLGLCDVISKDVSEYDGETVAKVVGRTCLSVDEIRKYANGGKIYVWEISDLVIFDQPKDLSEFGLRRAPQSWQYVEEKE